VRPDLWAGWRPNGVGEVKPNHYGEIFRTVWENRDSLPRAWAILTKGVCDGCALGTAGLHDWTIDGVHLCTIRLNLLRLNTMGALDPGVLGDVSTLRAKSGKELRALGRLAHPMVRRRGEAGFRRVTWGEALDLVADRIRRSDPERFALYLTSRGLTNETYYVAQKLVRFLGSPNIDNAARVCHAPSTMALKGAIGFGATTVSYTDLFASDLVVLFGSHVANAQPVMMKYLYLARRHGLKVVVVNPFREPALERYWIPSNPESAVFGTRMTDDFFLIHTGGDIGFVLGVLKAMLAQGTIDLDFISSCTAGWPELRAEVEAAAWDDLERVSGSTRADMDRFARTYGEARSAILIWSMGVTQHAFGSDNVRAIVNLALARGNIGRPGAGLMPIRGHSGVQGGAEMGAYATSLPGGVALTTESAGQLSTEYGFTVPPSPGLSASEMVEAAHRGELDVLYSCGGNFLEVLPDPGLVREALERVPLRVHQDVVVTTQMLLEPGEEVVLLPAATRYEQRDGGTETTTERRVVYGPQVVAPVGGARTEWEIFLDLARRVDPERSHLVEFSSGEDIRAEIARIVPTYRGVETLSKLGDNLQWGGERLGEGGRFPTTDGKAHFAVVKPPPPPEPGRFRLSTRRGKQFNTMVFSERDPLTGMRRHDVLMAPTDLEGLGLADGAPIIVRSAHGDLAAIARSGRIRPGNLQAFWPEANVLLAPGVRDPEALIPEYNAVVEVIPG
jgi:molybdopterin-dependent oxidoreductase alpha subunit